MSPVIESIDAHAAGAPLRLVTSGFPAAEGESLEEKRAWLDRHANDLRRAVLLEPRGHAGMVGAVLTAPASADAQAGCVFMHGGGFFGMCGHGVIAVTTIAIERGLLAGSGFAGDRWHLRLDVPAATLDVVADVRPADGTERSVRVSSVAYSGLPAAILAANVEVASAARRIRADLVWHGGLYAVVDAEQLGVPLTLATVPEMRRAATPLLSALERQTRANVGVGVTRELDGLVLTTASDVADLRLVTVYADGVVDRSPSGGGSGAALALLDAMGLAPDEREVRVEGLAGGVFTTRVLHRTTVEGVEAIVPQTSGTAWVTGEHRFLLGRSDPFRFGIA